jgi:hypothetical protein
MEMQSLLLHLGSIAFTCLYIPDLLAIMISPTAKLKERAAEILLFIV